jgi:hypothetical protein
MGIASKETSQNIDGKVSGENYNDNTATGVATYFMGANSQIPDPNDKRDCYERGGCGSCGKVPAYCSIAKTHLPEIPWHGCDY